MSRFPGLPLPLLAVASVATSAGVYSGRLVDVDGVFQPGIAIELRDAAGAVLASATSGADGSWSLDPSTSVQPRVRARGVSGNLVIDATRRLHVEFGGRDLSGRSRSGLVAATRDPAPAAMRSQDVVAPDTLVYSIGGRVFLRDTITTPDTGIVRIADTTWNAAITYGYLKDARDGNVYRTVKIGAQTWMAQNLAFVRDTSWRYRDSLGLERRYGRLYQWAAAMDTSGQFSNDVAEIPLPWRGICPEGWHLPSDAEWSVLVNFADSANSGTALKASAFASTGGAAAALDSWGFRVMAAGQVYWRADGIDRYVYTALGSNVYFWSASEMTTIRSWGRAFMGSNASSTRALYLKTNGQSVRCLRD